MNLFPPKRIAMSSPVPGCKTSGSLSGHETSGFRIAVQFSGFQGEPSKKVFFPEQGAGVGSA